MQDEKQDGAEGEEPDGELVFPAEDELEQSRREQQKVELPERTRTSPLLRRVIGGDPRDKGGGVEGGAGERTSPRGGLVRREIGKRSPSGPTRSQDVHELGDVSPGRTSEGAGPPPESPGWKANPLEGSTPDGGKGGDDGPKQVAESASPVSADGPRRRRRKQAVDQEAEWQQGGRSPAWWLGGGVLCVLLVGIAVFVMVRRGGFGEPLPPSAQPEAFVPTTSFESLPIADFVAQSAELLPVVRDIITKVESGAGGAELLRGGEASLERLKAWRKRYPAPSLFRDKSLYEIHASGTDRFAFVVMTGERQDFSRLMAYFVKQDGGMRLDWEATEGYSEVLVNEVDLLKDGQPRMMRGIIAVSNFYTDIFPEERYRSYTIHHDDPSEWLWAYAERDGDEDFGILRHMMQRDPLGRSRRVMVKIGKGAEGSRANQVLIKEFVRGGWIVPPPVDGGDR